MVVIGVRNSSYFDINLYQIAYCKVIVICHIPGRKLFLSKLKGIFIKLKYK